MSDMPLEEVNSLCQDRAKTIVSRDQGGQVHIGNNIDRNKVTHYKIDGVVIKEGIKCDYLLFDEEKRTAYLIELKGSDLIWAAKQLEKTQVILANQLNSYTVHYRIVANKCKTQEIETSEFKRYRLKWKRHLKYTTKKLEENI